MFKLLLQAHGGRCLRGAVGVDRRAAVVDRAQVGQLGLGPPERPVVVAVSGEPSMATAPSLTNFLKSKRGRCGTGVVIAPHQLQLATEYSAGRLILSTAMIVPLMTATPVDP